MLRSILILCGLSLLVACDDGTATDPLAGGPALQGVVRTVHGDVVSGARVAGAASIGRSAEDGRFAFAAAPGFQAIQVHADGFLPQSIPLRVQASTPTVVHPQLVARAPFTAPDADGEIALGDSLQLTIPEGTFLDLEDREAAVAVDISATVIDATTPDALRAYAVGARVQTEDGARLFRPVTIIALELRLASQTATQVGALTLTGPAVEDGAALYRFEPTQGVWTSAGRAVETPERAEFSVAGDGMWAIGTAVEPACVTGRVVDDAGEPVAGAFVTARGLERAGGAASADADGRFHLAADSRASLEVAAWHADLGDVRSVDFGVAGSMLPAIAGDARCADVGEWMVARGRFEGPAVGGDCFAALPAQVRGSCLAPWFEAGRCFDVDGACAVWAGEDFGAFHYRWETGAGLVVDALTLDAAGELAARVEYHGSGGLCLETSQRYVAAAPDEMPEPQPQPAHVPGVGTFQVTALPDTLEVECPDGAVHRLDPEVLDTYRRCLVSPSLEADCVEVAAPPAPEVIERLCNAATDCDGGEACCRLVADSPSGVCVSAPLCAQIGGVR